MSGSNKVCFVTGASSGIGKAIAQSLIKDNYTVIVTARRKERLEKLGAADVLAGDLCDRTFQKEAYQYIIDKYGKCDFLFNCAGVQDAATIEDTDIDRVSDMLSINVDATFRMTYLFLKQFKKQGFGHVVNISSVLGTKTRATAGAYAATKYAVEALSEALRMELSGTKIKVTCIEPGLVMTELHDHWKVHPKELMNIEEPLQPEDVAETVRFIMNQPDHVRIPRLMILPDSHNI